VSGAIVKVWRYYLWYHLVWEQWIWEKEWLTNKNENGIKQGIEKNMRTAERETKLYFSFFVSLVLLQLPSYIGISRRWE
jgi:hypothetical protein